MTWPSVAQFLILLAGLAALTRPLGGYMAKVFGGERTFLSRALVPLENFIYAVCAVDRTAEQTWTIYAGCVLAFSVANFAIFYALLRLQSLLPGNPNAISPVRPDLAFNTAISFMTNTSWQAYAGETALSYFSQMAGIAAQSFTSAAAGLAAAVALIRAFGGERSGFIGNFWVDMTRAVLYVLLPISLVGAVFLCSQGVVESLAANRHVATLEARPQVVPMGPVASQESIKLLSSDGGGYFNANSAHPFENPTPLTNVVEMLLMLAVPAGLTSTFGRMVNNRRHGWTLFFVMLALFAAGCLAVSSIERTGNPILHAVGVRGVNLEGKEMRFGASGSALFSVAATASSDGAVDSSHDSFLPLSGLVQLFNLTTGEVIFGGVGTGLISMIFMALLTVFIAGLLVGRTPEYLGKKIEAKEMKMVMLSFVATGAAVLLFAGLAFVVRFPIQGYWNPAGAVVSNLGNRGPHGLTEILYANVSAVATNGSALAGLDASSPWFNATLGMEMLIGRFLVLIPSLAIAGSLSRKRIYYAPAGATIPTHGPLFAALLTGAIVLLAALTFFPALSLGPLAEHFLASAGKVFR